MSVFAHSTILKKGDGGSPEVFTAIAKVTDISISGFSIDAVEVTSQDSADHFREYIPGMRDGGEVSFDLVFDPALTGHTALKTALETGAVSNWRVEFPVNPVKAWAFKGFLTSFEIDASMEEALTASATIKITGKPQIVTV
jgi:predicted secreted protein